MGKKNPDTQIVMTSTLPQGGKGAEFNVTRKGSVQDLLVTLAFGVVLTLKLWNIPVASFFPLLLSAEKDYANKSTTTHVDLTNILNMGGNNGRSQKD